MQNVNPAQFVSALRHLDSGEFICLLQDGVDYVACFSDGDTAGEFQVALGLVDHTEIVAEKMENLPFLHFWLNGVNVILPEAAAKTIVRIDPKGVDIQALRREEASELSDFCYAKVFGKVMIGYIGFI